MTSFERAVTEEQKESRKREVKDAFESQFAVMPLSQITLTTIAGDLKWTRSNLYKYYRSVYEILADVWAEKISVLHEDFNIRLEALVDNTPHGYAELAYRMFFTRSDVLRYLIIQPLIVDDPVALERMRAVRPSYKRWLAVHSELLMERFDLSKEQSEAVYLAAYYAALGLYNTEKFESRLVPEIADRYDDYVRWRFISTVEVAVINAQEYTRDPSRNPMNLIRDKNPARNRS